MSHLGISVYLSDRVKRIEYDGRCKENLPGPQAYFAFYGYCAFYAHGERWEIEELLDDQMTRRGRSRAKPPDHQIYTFVT